MSEQWHAFTRIIGGQLHSILMTTDFEADRASLPYIWSVTVEYAAGPQGLPSRPVSELQDLEDKVEAALSHLGARHLGHTLGAGKLRIIFAAPEPSPAEVQVKMGWFKTQKHRLESRHDPSWSVYDLELRPSPEELEDTGNLELIDVLAKHGDNHAKPRPVDFAARFPSAEARAAFLADVTEAGYRLSDNATWEPEPDDFWCEIVKETPVELPIIRERTTELRNLAQTHGGEFDGWACPVAP